MASGKFVAVTIVFALSTMHLVLVLGEGLECQKLPVEICAFAVSSSGVRCVLEKKYSSTSPQYECQSSGIMAQKMMEWIESEECLESCGLQRMFLGMSSDDLNSNYRFTSKLCSDKCRKSCPNIIDLYFNLAAGEGVYLPKLCETNKGYGADAPTTISKVYGADAPTTISKLYGADAPSTMASLLIRLHLQRPHNSSSMKIKMESAKVF